MLSTEFDKKFEELYHLGEKRFSDPQIDFGKSLLSSMMGGIGYFEGDWKLDDGMVGIDEDDLQQGEEDDYFAQGETIKYSPNPQMVESAALFTGVPSRTFFPRGFLWDTGFDLFLIQSFDEQLAMDILKSWLSTMDERGWIAREQILGAEARSKVPEEFQMQYPHYANPPIMVGILRKLIEKEKSGVMGKNR